MNIESTSDLRSSLREKTRPLHEAVEKSLDLMRPDFSLSDLQKILLGFFRFHQNFETHLESRSRQGCPASSFYLLDRRKVPWLWEDISHTSPSSWKTEFSKSEFHTLDSAGKIWGALYVIEGSTLGGQVITAHFQKIHGSSKQWNSRYFEGYKERTGLQWQKLLKEIQKIPNESHQTVVDGAQETFSILLKNF